MKKLLIILLLIMISSIVNAQVKWQIDQTHSKVSFNVTHLLISEVTGIFHEFEGNVSSNSPDNFTNSKINFSVSTKSVDTDNEERDKHLRSQDFLNVEKYPTMSFKGKSMKKISDREYLLVGDLTLNGVTNQVTFHAKHGGTIKDEVDQKTKAGFKISGEINRYDYNLKWNMPVQAESYAVSPEVEIVCHVRLVKG